MLGQDGKIDTEIVGILFYLNKKNSNANDLKSASAITNDVNISILEHYEMWLRENKVSFQYTTSLHFFRVLTAGGRVAISYLYCS
jgi:hypothetical protein